ncbi:sensor histidine kinase [Streptomyces sp. NPDC004610]|uniref:sensor histidine kinase n=1 Tax=unclassified Streptomyces TaxID=2593676 RepID=UPI0033ACDBB0
MTDSDDSNDSDDSDRDIERRWERFRRWGPYGLLAVGSVMSAVTAPDLMPGTAERWAAGALVVTSVVLQESFDRARSRAAQAGRPLTPSPLGLAFFLLRWGITLTLIWLNPFFAFAAAIGLFDVAELIEGRGGQRFGVFITAVSVSLAQGGGLPLRGPAHLVVLAALVAANTVLYLVIGHISEKEEERAKARAATIAELERTNAALTRALDENRALHAQLLVQAREAGVADERRRLAAEIHDTIAQGLTGIIAQLQVVAGTPDPGLARTHLDRAADLARHSLGEARRSVHNLAPVALAGDGLPEALKKTVADWGDRTGVRAGFTVTGTAEHLHDEVSATLLRIAQEALSNAARHAAASRVGVTLSYMGDEVVLDIRDDGRGFDPAALPGRTRTGGFGLDGMRARADRIAGSFAVESEPGGGTALSARVPLVRHEQP